MPHYKSSVNGHQKKVEMMYIFASLCKTTSRRPNDNKSGHVEHLYHWQLPYHFGVPKQSQYTLINLEDFVLLEFAINLIPISLGFVGGRIFWPRSVLREEGSNQPPKCRCWDEGFMFVFSSGEGEEGLGRKHRMHLGEVDPYQANFKSRRSCNWNQNGNPILHRDASACITL